MAIKEIQMDQMSKLRDLSRNVANHLSEEITAFTKTLALLFSPRKVLGEFMSGSGKDKVIGAENNFSVIEERYKAVMREAFGFSVKLSSIVPAVSSKVTLNNWEYIEDIDGTKITFTAPTQWVLGYDNSLTLERLLETKLQGKTLSQEEISNFVITKLVLQRLFEVAPNLTRLYAGLGYTVESRTMPDVSGSLTYMVLTAPVESFRPQNDMVKMATQFSGSESFAELIDEEAIQQIENRIQTQLNQYL